MCALPRLGGPLFLRLLLPLRGGCFHALMRGSLHLGDSSITLAENILSSIWPTALLSPQREQAGGIDLLKTSVRVDLEWPITRYHPLGCSLYGNLHCNLPVDTPEVGGRRFPIRFILMNRYSDLPVTHYL
jgi:hypothetical protein